MGFNLDNLFTYHKPIKDQPERYERIRAQGKAMAEFLILSCPDSAELTKAIRKIQEAVMWANASIACNENERE